MLQKKTLAFDDCQIKAKKSGGAIRFTGYASKFGGVDYYGDTIVRGAFADTLKGRKKMPLMLWQHSMRQPIGKYPIMEEDSAGLFLEGEMTPGHSLASDVAALMEHGAIDGLSIGFEIPPGGATEVEPKAGEANPIIRMLTRIDLIEVSIVTMPADDAARIDTASVKALIDECGSIADMENLLREAAGFSKSQATGFIARLQRLSRSESGTAPDVTRAASALDETRALLSRAFPSRT